MKDPEYVTLPQERLEQLEKLLGRHGLDWRLVNVSTLATPAGDPAWKDRWYKTLMWHRHFLQTMRALGFDTRAGHGRRYIQDRATKAFVHVNPIYK